MEQRHPSPKKTAGPTHLLSIWGGRNIFWLLAALALIAWVIWETVWFRTINLELTLVFMLGIATLVVTAFSINSHRRNHKR